MKKILFIALALFIPMSPAISESGKVSPHQQGRFQFFTPQEGNQIIWLHGVMIDSETGKLWALKTIVRDEGKNNIMVAVPIPFSILEDGLSYSPK
jgi:hypothetical protein